MVRHLDEQLKAKAAQLHAVEKNIEACMKRLEALQSEVNSYRDMHGFIPDSLSCDSCYEILESTELHVDTKKSLISRKTSRVLRSLKDVAEKHRKTIASVLGHAISFSSDPETTNMLSQIVDIAVEHEGINEAEKDIFSEKTYPAFTQMMKVPDWVFLYFKLAMHIPDESWQTILSLTNLGNTRVSFSCINIITCFKSYANYTMSLITYTTNRCL